MTTNNTISAPILVLVEGQDDAFFLNLMIAAWYPGREHLFDIESAGGLSNLKSRFAAVSVRLSAPLKVVAVMADSDDSPSAAAQVWQDLKQKHEAAIAKPCLFLLLPDSESKGSLETLVLRSLGQDAFANCSIGFRDCIKQIDPLLRNEAQWDKLAVQSWLNAKTGQAFANLFRADEKHSDAVSLDANHAAFQSVKQFLDLLLTHV
jgi:hypothetical protein